MATPQITLTATLEDVLGNIDGGAFLKITLAGFNGLVPRVTGTTVLSRASQKLVQPATGQITTELWGNDVISPAGTYYCIEIFDSKKNLVQAGNFQITGNGTVDLSNIAQYLPPPPTEPGQTPVLLNPAGGASQTINGSVVITGSLTVDGPINFSFGAATVPINGGTPVFNGNNGLGQFISLTQNVTSSTAINFPMGIPLTFQLKQDITGGRSFAWPANFVEPPSVNPAPNGSTVQAWVKMPDGNFYAVGSAIWV